MEKKEPADPHKPRKPRASTPAHLAVALHTVLDAVDGARTNLKVAEGKTVFAQGEAADAVYYIKSGRIQLNVVSDQGKEGVIALLGPGEYFGEGCLGHQPVRLASAVATAAAALIKIDKATMAHLLREKADFSKQFTAYLVSRTIQVEADLVDQLFNSSEKRLARLLLLLANYNNDGVLHPIVPRISQDVLAARVGTTRARINFFMNKFRKLGLIEYNGDIKVHTSLLNVIVHD